MKNNIKKYTWIWIAIICIMLGILYFMISSYSQEKNTVPQVCDGENCFTVELARTSAEQELGLMNRTGMDEKHGMLFIFPKSDLYNFWMKNTLIPLDMLRINDQYRVVRIMTAQSCIADPCPVYKPEIGASYVLEVNAGIAAKYGIVEGTIVQLKNIK